MKSTRRGLAQLGPLFVSDVAQSRSLMKLDSFFVPPSTAIELVSSKVTS